MIASFMDSVDSSSVNLGRRDCASHAITEMPIEHLASSDQESVGHMGESFRLSLRPLILAPDMLLITQLLPSRLASRHGEQTPIDSDEILRRVLPGQF